ncbi:hypothetical protein ABKA04_007825 [Annulohypoxylon sp. FPYF3050]
MKANFASTLAFMPFLAIVSAMEVSDVYKTDIGNCNCNNIHLTGNHVLNANCVRPGYGSRLNYSLDLNRCFANYLGTLNYIPEGNGDFGASCGPCKMNGTKLDCECEVGKGRGTRHNEVELNDYSVLQIRDDILTCDSTADIQKRAVNKEARFFLA